MPGTLILPALETPRSPRVADSYGPLVKRWAQRKINMELGPWQEYALDRLLEHDDDGNLIAEQGLLSVGRQNGKTVIMRALTGWMLDQGHSLPAFSAYDLILFCAHDANQAHIPYDFVRRDMISWANITHTGRSQEYGSVEHMRNVKRATLNTGLEINGVRVQTATRQAGSGRGVSAGLILFDEVLTQTTFDQYDVLSPAQSAIANALMLLTSTAGFADSIVLRQFYNDLYRQATGADRPDDRFMGLWWRADEDDVGLDWEQLEKANPGLNDGRLRRSAIEREYRILPRGSWTRERLNRWADERVDAPFSLGAWGACREREPLRPECMGDEAPYVISVDCAADWSHGTIVVAGMRTDGLVGVEVHRHLEARPDTPLTADDFVREIVKVAAKVRVVSIPYSSTSALTPAFVRAQMETQLPFEAVGAPKTQLACMDFAEAVIARRMVHDDPVLDAQISGAQRRFVGSEGSWRWSISGTNPVTAVIAMTYAVSWAAKYGGQAQIF